MHCGAEGDKSSQAKGPVPDDAPKSAVYSRIPKVQPAP